MGHFLTNVRRWNGSAWVPVNATGTNPGPTELFAYNGTAWVPVQQVQRWTGTAWVPVFTYSGGGER